MINAAAVALGLLTEAGPPPHIATVVGAEICAAARRAVEACQRRGADVSFWPTSTPSSAGLRHDLDRDRQTAAPRLGGSGRRGTDRRGPAPRCAGRHWTRPRPSLDDWPPSEQLMLTDSGLVLGAQTHPDGSIEDPERED